MTDPLNNERDCRAPTNVSTPPWHGGCGGIERTKVNWPGKASMVAETKKEPVPIVQKRPCWAMSVPRNEKKRRGWGGSGSLDTGAQARGEKWRGSIRPLPLKRVIMGHKGFFVKEKSGGTEG